jgi:hypothetical protein
MFTKVYSRMMAALAVGVVLVAAGCSSDVDPDKVKVDAPGYYTGPMEKKGGGGAALGGDGKDSNSPAPAPGN